MASIAKPSIPKGTRDFGPAVMARRSYIFDTIRTVFRRYGYQPLETPSMENLSTLLGKYGEEGDKLLFKILNSGDFLRGTTPAEVEAAFGGADNEDDKKTALLSTRICEKGLRYDLTVPFARYVVQHQSEIVFPFKRYQIQPVWRADRPQKGRYREFVQCDVDVVGSASLLCEAELVQIVQDVFAALGIRVVLKINNRKILYGIAESMGAADKMVDITVAIDKLDKIGLDAVNEELASKGLSPEAIAALKPILELQGTNREKLAAIAAIIGDASETGRRGIAEVTEIFDTLDAVGGVQLPVELDLSLARGLNYYTGAIFEVKALDFAIGSISGGGRYDDLTGIFGLPDTSGVGISFGADRIYDVMEGLGLFPAEVTESVRALFVNFGGDDLTFALKQLALLRAAGIPAEVYPDAVKLKKQFDYAEKRGIPYMVFIGEQERADGTVTLKNIVTGEQQTFAAGELAARLK